MTLFQTLSLLALALAIPVPAVSADESAAHLPSAENLKSSAVDSRARTIPVVLMVSSTNCGYCARLKAEIFVPLLRHHVDSRRQALVELLIDVDAEVLDFNGKKVNASALAARYDATLTPTVLFLAPDGSELAERMVGVQNFDFYPWYFDQRVELATKRLRHVLDN